MAVNITRADAAGIVRKIENEAYTIKLMLRICDLDLLSEDRSRLPHIFTFQTAAIENRRAAIGRHLVNMEVLRQLHASIFTPAMAMSWVNFNDPFHDLQQLKINNVNKIPDWVARLQKNITELFGVDLSPSVDNPYEVKERSDPDAGFVCDAIIRAKLVTAGSGRNIELGQKSVMAYVDGNMVKPHDKFSGERDEDSIHELFDRLEEIHLAPVTQVSYKMKVDAVFKCLEGRARQDVIGFKGASTRLEYLELWRGLFRQYGVTANEVARHLRTVNGAAPKSTDMKDMMSYMNVLNNAAVSLKRLGFPEDQIASSIWNSVISTVPSHPADYCRRKVPRFDEDYGSDVSTWHSIDGLKKFDGFYAYISRF
jgi:hypothetical protein